MPLTFGEGVAISQECRNIARLSVMINKAGRIFQAGCSRRLRDDPGGGGGSGPPLGVITLSQQFQIFLEMLINKTEVFVCAPDDSCIGEAAAAVPPGSREQQLAPAWAADGSMCHLLPPQQVISIISPLFSATGGEILAPRTAARY